MKYDERISYYKAFPDKFIEDCLGIKLLWYQKLLLRMWNRKKDISAINLWRYRYLNYNYIRALCETIWNNPEVVDKIKGHRMTDKESSNFINEEIAKATMLPENINDVLESFCAGKQGTMYVDDAIYLTSNKKEGKMKTRISLSDHGMFYGEKYIETTGYPGVGYWQSITKEYLFKISAWIAMWLYKRRM